MLAYPACAWPRAQPTACFVSALPSSVSHKLDVRAFGVFVRCRVVTPALAKGVCEAASGEVGASIIHVCA